MLVAWQHQAITWTNDNFIIKGVLWRWPESNFTMAHDLDLKHVFRGFNLKISLPHLPGAKWVNTSMTFMFMYISYRRFKYITAPSSTIQESVHSYHQRFTSLSLKTYKNSFYSNFLLLSHQVTLLHMPRQLSCRGMCKTVTRSDHYL